MLQLLLLLLLLLVTVMLARCQRARPSSAINHSLIPAAGRPAATTAAAAPNLAVIWAEPGRAGWADCGGAWTHDKSITPANDL